MGNPIDRFSKTPTLKPNPAGYSGPRDLTPQEIESLRQDLKDSSRLLKELRKANPRKK